MLEAEEFQRSLLPWTESAKVEKGHSRLIPPREVHCIGLERRP